jgi:hypothetical protein
LRATRIHRIPRSTFVTTRPPLLMSAGRRGVLKMICPTGKAEYFFERDWTTQISLNRLAKFVFWRSDVAHHCVQA